MKSNPLTQLFETTICPVHKSAVKDRCRVEMIGRYCANCCSNERSSIFNCTDPKLIDPYTTKYRGHLPDIDNFETLFLHLVTRSLELFQLCYHEVQSDKGYGFFIVFLLDSISI